MIYTKRWVEKMKSEIRQSSISALLDKVRKQDYGNYLLKASIIKIRGFSGEDITFDFPVTALIGPNGSGKSSVLGAAGCAYKSIKPSMFFPKSAIGDETMSGWRTEYDIIDKKLNPRQTVKRSSNFRQAKWVRGEVLEREVLFYGIERTVPAGEKAKFKKLTRSTYQYKGAYKNLDTGAIKQIEHVLGKSVSNYTQANISDSDSFFIGKDNGVSYSEFHFGAGESSIIRMISSIESAPQGSLVLIEEIENGLHPVATRRMVEYLIDVAERKSIQAIFTTHSDYALEPLPTEAIWACIQGKLQQGKLSVESLRAVSGRVEKKLAIFVEDEFSKEWVEKILREHLGSDFDQLEVHAVQGDGNAVKTHRAHLSNPSVTFKSLCIIDGDSSQQKSESDGILQLPGKNPELEVFSSVISRINEDGAILTVSLQKAPEAQAVVQNALNEIEKTNRDPHLIFNQIGIKIGFVSETIVKGAFLTLWARNNQDFCTALTNSVRAKLQ